jgi:hypothetical protein
MHICLQFTTNQVQSIPAPNMLINEYHGLLRNLHILGTMEWQEAREAVPAIDFVQQQMKAAWPWYLVCCIKYYWWLPSGNFT